MHFVLSISKSVDPSYSSMGKLAWHVRVRPLGALGVAAKATNQKASVEDRYLPGLGIHAQVGDMRMSPAVCCQPRRPRLGIWISSGVSREVIPGDATPGQEVLVTVFIHHGCTCKLPLGWNINKRVEVI